MLHLGKRYLLVIEDTLSPTISYLDPQMFSRQNILSDSLLCILPVFPNLCLCLCLCLCIFL